MLEGLEAYGSDNSDSEVTQGSIQSSSVPKKSATSTTKPSLLPPSRTKSKRPVFMVTKPSKGNFDDDEDDQERVAKKPRLESHKGAGSSSLLAMLPAPSKAPPPASKVLGSATRGSGTGITLRSSAADELPGGAGGEEIDLSHTNEVEEKSTALVPSSITKGKTKSLTLPSKATPPVPAVDFFSLGTTASMSTSSTSTRQTNAPLNPLKQDATPTSIMSAPDVPAFEPPTPTVSDPYPGYYQLPSGQWVAYEPEFYRKHYESWFGSQDLDGNLQKGFEGAEEDGTVEIDAQTQLDSARKEREEKKGLTADAGKGPSAPRMNIKPPKIGSRARTRHQLTALLTEAYENREALEEKIAQGRRNRKEAGNKYGF